MHSNILKSQHRNWVRYVLAALSLSSAACSSGEQGNEDKAAATDPDAIVRFESSEGTTAKVESAPSAAGEEDVASTSQALSSASFTRSCGPWSIAFYGDGSIWASGNCRRINGSYRYTTWGRGFCNGDLANCDGYLRCGGC